MAAPFNRPLRGLLFNVAADHGLAPEATIRCPLRGLKSMPPGSAYIRHSAFIIRYLIHHCLRLAVS